VSGCAPPPAHCSESSWAPYELYLPGDEALAAITAPVRLLVTEHTLRVFAEVANRFGERLGVEVAVTPGRHDAYHEHPNQFADAMRPFLRQVST
jgi:pimeloyl-ACP methyl ester carboxylesterase